MAQGSITLLTIRVCELVLYVFFKELENGLLKIISFVDKGWELLSDISLTNPCTWRAL